MNVRLLAIAILGVVTACAKSAPRATEAPAAVDAVAAPASLDELEAELGRYEGELRTLGLPGAKDEAAPTKPAPADGGGEPASVNEDDAAPSRVCELKDAICGLKDRICGLADEHDGEARYASACERATGDCDTVTEACDAHD
jgi:hypothetical protein